MDQPSLSGVTPGGDENLFETPEPHVVGLLMAVSDSTLTYRSETLFWLKSPKGRAY